MIAFLVSLIFFIVKHIFNRNNEDINFNKYLIRDTSLIFLIVICVLNLNNLYKEDCETTEIFTGRPCF